MRIDLHTHSTASDGTDSPGDLVGKAAAAGLDVVALTDHDTTAGWAEAAGALPSGLTLVPGAEFSCVHHEPDGRRISLHILAYLFDPDDERLRAERKRLRDSRVGRGRRMVERLAADGHPVEWDRVRELAGGGSVGRPHIGRALVEAGAVPDVDTAFRELLSGRGRYYVPKEDTPVREAIGLIRSAGGLPVFAHPLARRRGPVVSDEVIAELAGAGLVGLEVDHPDHDEVDRAHAAQLAKDLGLIATGSSDYHGTNKSVLLGAHTTAEEMYERLLALPAARAPVRC